MSTGTLAVEDEVWKIYENGWKQEEARTFSPPNSWQGCSISLSRLAKLAELED